jgi:hypothetical protein
MLGISRGLIPEEGACLDTTIIETSRNHKCDEGSHTRDKTNVTSPEIRMLLKRAEPFKPDVILSEKAYG